MVTTQKAKKKKTARKTRKTAAATKQSRRRNIAVSKKRSAAKKNKKKRLTKRASKEVRSPEPSTLGGRTFSVEARTSKSRRRSSASAGPSGDAQGLSRKAVVDSESVEELVDEGQAREAAAISGVEDALDPDQGEVRTREVLEDDVPEEYRDDD